MIELPDLDNIKILRKKLGWSQVQLAKAAGISQSMINKIENGVKMPSYDTANLIFKFLSEGLLQQAASNKKAKDIASPNPIFVTPDESVNQAIIKMGDRYDQVPVIQEEKCVGSITSKTIVSLISKDKFRELKIADVMAEPFPVISENEPLRNVEKMLEIFDAILTSEHGKITGIITPSDIIKH